MERAVRAAPADTTGGTTAFTGFTAGQLLPWFMLLFSLGLVAVEWSRRMRLVSPIGSTYGFGPFRPEA